MAAEKPQKTGLEEKWAEAVRLLAPAAKAGRDRAVKLQKEYAAQLGRRKIPHD